MGDILTPRCPLCDTEPLWVLGAGTQGTAAMPEREPDWDIIMEMEAESRLDAEITEAEAVGYIKRLALLEREPGSERAVLSIGPFTAFTLLGALQLATRHPEMSPSQRELIGAVIGQMRPLFAGTPGEQLLRLGDYAAYDIDRTCRYPSGPHAPGCPPDGHPGFAAGDERDRG